MQGKGERYVFLDGLRGLAALSIAAHHFTQHSGHRELFASAALAVDFFFCLSGFVLAHAYYARLAAGMNLGSYLRKRLIRLYPMYIVGMLLGIGATVYLHEVGFTSMSWAKIRNAALFNVFYIPYFNEEWIRTFVLKLHGAVFPMNNPAWSLFFGIIANMVFAASVRFWKNAPIVILATSIAIFLAIQGNYREGPGWSTFNFIAGFPRVFFSFFMGVVIFQYRHRFQALPRIAWPILFFTIVALVLVPRFPGHKYYWLFGALIVMPLLVSMGSQSPVTKGSFWHKALLYSGRISYPVFCIHYPLLMVAGTVDPNTPFFWPMWILFLVVTLVLSHLFLVHYDEPFRAWLTAKLESPRANHPAKDQHGGTREAASAGVGDHPRV
jgi:peptidoglycan/LPS O-acetylase OafA/YrhL